MLIYDQGKIKKPDASFPGGTGYVHFPGSSGYVTGENSLVPNVSRQWDPVNKRVAPVGPPIPPGAYQGGQTVQGGQNSQAAPGGFPGGNGSQFSLLTQTKSPEIAAQIDQALGDLNKLRSSGTTDLSSFRTGIESTQPQLEDQTAQENAVLDRLYGGGVRDDLAGLRTNERAAREEAVQRSLGDLKRLLSLDRLGQSQGGGQAAGTGSYLQKQAIDRASELRSQADLADAAQARQDYQNVFNSQVQLKGLRNQAIDELIKRGLTPLEAENQFYAMMADALNKAQVGQLANTFYGLGNPAGYIGDTYGGLQSAQLAGVNSDRSYDLNLRAAQRAENNQDLQNKQASVNLGILLNQLKTGIPLNRTNAL